MPSDITPKIILYLEQALQNDPDPRSKENRAVIIDYFRNSDGECVGKSALWLYGRRIADEPPTEELKPKDDIHFFHAVEKTLKDWNGETALSSEQQANIDRYISHILLYQRFDLALLRMKRAQTSDEPALGYDNRLHNSNDQGDLSLTLEDTKRGSPVESLKVGSLLLTKDLLLSRLSQIVKPKSMILITNHNHAMAIYQEEKKVSGDNVTDGELFFYDANTGEKPVDSIEELRNCFWESSDPSLSQSRTGFTKIIPSSLFFREVHIRIFRFPNDPIYQYPAEEALKMTDGEFIDIFGKNPSLLKFIPQKHSLSDFFDDQQITRLLGNNALPLEAKKILLAMLLTRSDRISFALAGYIFKECGPLLEEVKGTYALAEKDLTALSDRVNNALYPSKNPEKHLFGNVSDGAKDFLLLYKAGVITEKDKKNLDIYDVIYILAAAIKDPTWTEIFWKYKEFAEDLFQHCKREVKTPGIAANRAALEQIIQSIVIPVLEPALPKHASYTTREGAYIQENIFPILKAIGQDFGIKFPLPILRERFNDRCLPIMLKYFHFDNEQAYDVLKNPAESNNVKKAWLVEAFDHIQDKPFLLAGCMYQKCGKLLKELQKENRLTEIQLNALKHMVQPSLHPSIHFSEQLADPTKEAQAFLLLYENKLIRKKDKKALDAYDVICILEASLNTNDKYKVEHTLALAKDLFHYCKRDVTPLSDEATKQVVYRIMHGIISPILWDGRNPFGDTFPENIEAVNIILKSLGNTCGLAFPKDRILECGLQIFCNKDSTKLMLTYCNNKSVEPKAINISKVLGEIAAQTQFPIYTWTDRSAHMKKDLLSAIEKRTGEKREAFVRKEDFLTMLSLPKYSTLLKEKALDPGVIVDNALAQANQHKGK